MKMDGWRDHLHFELLGNHVLFPGLILDSTWHFILASLLTTSICLFERALTFAVSKDWCPILPIRHSRLFNALWKTCLYWIVTLARLLYMLVAMTNSAGLILVAATSLSIGQFVIYCFEEPQVDHRLRERDSENVKEPLLDSPQQYNHSVPLRHYSASSFAPPYDYQPSSSNPSNEEQYPYPDEPTPTSSQSHPLLRHQSTQSQYQLPSTTSSSSTSPSSSRTRPRSKSKPADIFIHPAESNLARADAAAQQLGVSGDTERVKSNQYPVDDDAAWEVGKGKDFARELLLGSAVSRKPI
ncbi:hypothetical protein BXZ70DRAFT_947289 [Cristinia sonorae]|uniref:Copper transporter n=1 Tax=Cristinia sonorae TaxID=1940300 RepID=A0A8K0UKQ4_9AGAR|nr:hypothetical protein BXZ70DRAFT_947289 [Cristinia sonorae]